MRYRLKKDYVILNSENNIATLMLTGDKVFINLSAGGGFKVYSCFSRRLLGQMEGEPSSDLFEKDQPSGDSQGRPSKLFRRGLTSLLIFILPLGTIAQSVEPVSWSVKEVQVQEDVWEIQITAEMEPGWWLYHPNMSSRCKNSTRVSVTSDGEVEQLDSFSVVTFNNGDYDPNCGADRYYTKVLFVAPFKVISRKSTTLCVQLDYYPTNRYGSHGPQTVKCWLPVQRQIPSRAIQAHSNTGEGIIIRTIPTPMGQIIWRIVHPFRKPYWY